MNFVKARPRIVDEIVTRLGQRYHLFQNREGIHATDCIYCLRKAYWNRVNPLPPTPAEILYYLRGLGMQDALLGGKSGSLVSHQGIALSPDFFEDGTLAELKTTMISEKTLDANEFPEGWLRQLMAYCYALNLKSAVLIVLTIIKSKLLSYIVTFSSEELEENWRWILERAKELGIAYEKNIVPKVEEEEKWQCSSCRYCLRCQTLEEGDNGS